MNTPTTVAQVAAAIAQSISYATQIPLGREALLEIEQIISNYCRAKAQLAAEECLKSVGMWAPDIGKSVALYEQFTAIISKHFPQQPLPVSGETPRVSSFIKGRDCGKYEHEPDSYGDDWSHDDIRELVYLACQLERECATERAARERDIPTITGRTKNIVRERLGEVLRHTDGPNSASHGCVEVTKAYSELEYWIARAEAAESKSGDVAKLRMEVVHCINSVNDHYGHARNSNEDSKYLLWLSQKLNAALASVPAEKRNSNEQ